MSIPGYTLGSNDVPRAPVTLSELEEMKKTALFGEEDVKHLRASLDVLAPQTDAVLDVWYGFVASQPHLVRTFARPGGAPDAAYLASVRRRFGQWILDTARAEYGQAWLDYQIEIGRRHHRLKKNRTDGVDAEPIVPLRHLFPLIVPVVTTLRPFLEKSGAPRETVDAMQAAWLKSVLIQVTLWAHPYVRETDF